MSDNLDPSPTLECAPPSGTELAFGDTTAAALLATVQRVEGLLGC
jgi:hypothetical protein